MKSENLGRVLSRIANRPLDTKARMCPAGVTIAIPNWNHEFVLPRSISTGLHAIRELGKCGIPGEVLVVDDDSRDGSRTLLTQLEALYFEDGLRVSALATNTGLPSARNHALGVANYRYIVFMDADNELVSENIHSFYRSILATGAAAVYGNLLWESDSDEKIGIVSNESVQDRIYDQNYVDAFAMFDRLQILDAGGYLPTLDVLAREDWELYLHLAATGRRIVFVPMFFGIYHVLSGSMIAEADQGDDHGRQQKHMRRVFDQLSIRRQLPLNTRWLRYHPDTGYL